MELKITTTSALIASEELAPWSQEKISPWAVLIAFMELAL